MTSHSRPDTCVSHSRIRSTTRRDLTRRTS
jgi:hypothetical protein